MIEDFLDWLSIEGNTRVKTGLSYSTVNRYCATISIIFKKALKLNLIKFYPTFSWKKR